MASQQSIIRPEVLEYLHACVNILISKDGSHDEFLLASQTLQQKDGTYTDEELILVQEMLYRLSAKHGSKLPNGPSSHYQRLRQSE